MLDAIEGKNLEANDKTTADYVHPHLKEPDTMEDKHLFFNEFGMEYILQSRQQQVMWLPEDSTASEKYTVISDSGPHDIQEVEVDDALESSLLLTIV